ncbi:MAG: energy transducer TonB [Verrucomicrobiota bacterium]|nr:energy transducer TonB [Verrucomicrobiota bacterium]
MWLLLIICGLVPPLACAAEATAEKAALKAVISAPRPEYPFEARKFRVTGAGAAILQVDAKTGLVTDVTMQPSTGHTMLDNAVLSAFRRWRFRPDTVSKARLPITFAMPMTIDPGRWYPFSGTVRAVDARAGTILVRWPTASDTIVITDRTMLSKNGQHASIAAIAVGDEVKGRATVRPPDFKAVAQALSVRSPAQR